MRGGARRPHARRSLSTLSVRPRAPTQQMGRYGASCYDLKYQVSVWAMCGLSLTALFQSRSGILPMFVLMTRTPCEAGELDTRGIIHISSRAIFQTSLAMRVRSWSFTLNDLRYLSISSRMRAGGVLPLVPAL